MNQQQLQQLQQDFACFADPQLRPGQGTITIGCIAIFELQLFEQYHLSVSSETHPISKFLKLQYFYHSNTPHADLCNLLNLDVRLGNHRTKVNNEFAMGVDSAITAAHECSVCMA